ncbi:subtilisin-like serine-protease S [Cryptomeria japonica]|uniref:subtilisin-like serine-protease S n=1 Tax=Cryptomeria japonica TaxID=3369 RepID=UPI0027DAA799|nr:subtilisin-like serine-protease S [Cryptomeria japonica]
MLVLQQLVVFLLFSSITIHAATNHEVKNYIVYMGDKSHPTAEATISSNHDLLAKVRSTREGANGSVIHHYTKSFRGFSALLTPDEAASLSEMDEVISVFESKTRRVHTTHSWEFLGVDKIYSGATNCSKDYTKAQADVIVGMIDTGVWPESKSFSDKGMPPVPSRFKGTCQTGEKFSAYNCNRKLIGARFYFKGFEAENGPLESLGAKFFRSPRDADGHGSHTASTAAGTVVQYANELGIAQGTAMGGAPGARLSIYKACWVNSCSDADLLAAFDDATKDGVDIISISVGSSSESFFTDSIALGSFHAFSNGILVSASAGNDGLPGSASNLPPWIFTVAASSTDRRLTSNVVLGNNMILKGEAVNPLKLNVLTGVVAGSSFPAPGIPQANASFCLENTLDPAKVKGKIVVCTISGPLDDRTLKSEVVRDAGGVGIIVVDPIAKDVAFQFVIPGTEVGLEEGQRLMAYLISEKYPTAYITQTSTVFSRNDPGPEMAVFSSLGPNGITPDIIKPDITAPGLNILAAWSPVAISEAGGRTVDFNVISGTSMSCPHVSGVAALIKSQHPTWSPAAIKSVIMTTASLVDKNNDPILRSPLGNSTGPFDYGSGHIDPMAALDPGLFYDYNVKDVINFLCSNGATPAQLRNLAGYATKCVVNPPPAYNLNYPSIGVANLKGRLTVYRALTSCGSEYSVYQPVVQPPPGVDVEVLPKKLYFNKEGQKISFSVKFTVKKAASNFVFGSLTWSDGKHRVYTPIAVNPTSV